MDTRAENHAIRATMTDANFERLSEEHSREERHIDWQAAAKEAEARGTVQRSDEGRLRHVDAAPDNEPTEADYEEARELFEDDFRVRDLAGFVRDRRRLSEVDDVLVVNWVAVNNGDYRAALYRLLNQTAQDALDPAVSRPALALIEQGKNSKPAPRPLPKDAVDALEAESRNKPLDTAQPEV